VIQLEVPGVDKWRATPDQISAQTGVQRLWDATMLDDKKCAPENGAA